MTTPKAQGREAGSVRDIQKIVVVSQPNENARSDSQKLNNNHEFSEFEFENGYDPGNGSQTDLERGRESVTIRPRRFETFGESQLKHGDRVELTTGDGDDDLKMTRIRALIALVKLYPPKDCELCVPLERLEGDRGAITYGHEPECLHNPMRIVDAEIQGVTHSSENSWGDHE